MALVPDDPKQRNAFLVGLVALAGLYFFWDMWYTPRTEELAEMESHLEQLEDQNRRAQILATRGGEQLQERLALFERHVVQLEQLIPESEEVPQLLNDMTVEARRVNVDIALMRPEPPEPGPFYTRQSYQLEAVGDFHSVGRFLTAVASLSRIITPVDLDVTPFQGNQATVDAEAPVVARFRIQTYVLPEGQDAAGGERNPSSGADA